MNRLCVDYGYQSLNHFGEELCGDNVVITEDEQGRNQIFVLADGLGSGVKASILSTLTSKMIASMIAGGATIDECVNALANTLPVCKERGIAYSTFTIINIVDMKFAEIYQFDNPIMIMFRNGKNYYYPIDTHVINDKKISISRIPIQEGDAFIAFSDGVIHAGIGATLNFGWQRDNVIDFMEAMYGASYSSKSLATILTDRVNDLYQGRPGDDVTALVIKVRRRIPINIVAGPPKDKEDDLKMMDLFFSKDGKHIVCGGTTATIVSSYLKKQIETSLNYESHDVPPMAIIDGVDLVTEGVITLSKTLENIISYTNDNERLYDWAFKKDGASLLTKLLLEEASDITFYVGRAVNPAHQNPNLPINFNIKMHIVEELNSHLKMIGKRIKICYF
ncbi:MAG: SpoIIE family protein phosphatase [Bacilli bacterium]|jgi:serine/threonine protein phosphatase PrpC|nr:SpoIIE family protein phosphatase [Bacilli bacterium]MDD4006061.1 SpoIIE family protein phosphatase [Bacilli bacterium]